MDNNNNQLNVSNLVVRSSTRVVVNDVSLKVGAGQIVALLGPNGAGKSELVLAMAGLLPKENGSVTVGSEDLTRRRPEVVRAAGVAAVPEGHRVLRNLSVDDNLGAAGSMHNKVELNRSKARAYEVFPELKPLSDNMAGSLSGGQQQMLSLAQAIMCRPKFLLADEMSLGLAPIVVSRLMAVLEELRQSGVGVLLIEQFTHLALGIADYAYVLQQGKIVFSGLPEALKSNPDILHDAYLSS